MGMLEAKLGKVSWKERSQELELKAEGSLVNHLELDGASRKQLGDDAERKARGITPGFQGQPRSRERGSQGEYRLPVPSISGSR